MPSILWPTTELDVVHDTVSLVSCLCAGHYCEHSACPPPCLFACLHTHCVCVCMHDCVRASMHSCGCACICACMRAYVHRCAPQASVCADVWCMCAHSAHFHTNSLLVNVPLSSAQTAWSFQAVLRTQRVSMSVTEVSSQSSSHQSNHI